MIINGFFYHSDYLVQYLQREQKKAENDHIEFSEFIGRTIIVLKDLKEELYRLGDQKKAELEAKKNGANNKVIDEEINNIQITENVFLPLEDYTEDEVPGSLGFWDLDRFGSAINEAFDFYWIEKEEKDGSEPIKYFLRSEREIEGKMPMPSYKFPHIFIHNAFEVWESLFESFQINSSSRTDVKFSFEKMKKDNMIRKNILYPDFLEWVNDTYELEVGKISYADLKSSKRLSIYNNAFELYQKQV